MYLQNINIINFKNIKSAEIDFSQRFNCFVGLNGAGKTNFLDAIYYLSLSKSLSGSSDRQNINHNSDFFMIEGNYYRENTHNNYTFSFSPSAGKVAKRNGKNYVKLSEHIGAVPLISISPNDNSLIEDSGEARRKYLNTFLSQLNNRYLTTLMRYNSVIAERNLLLKDVISSDKLELIEIFDMQLTELGTSIYTMRRDIIEELLPLVTSYYYALSGGRESISLGYKSQLEKDSMDNLLRQSFERDKILGYTSVGITRDDIKMTIEDYPIKRFGSQGQLKSFLIAMKLAQYDIIAKHTNMKPILLLDDIFDRLDPTRVSELIGIVGGDKFGQIFISDCKEKRIEEIMRGQSTEYNKYRVSEGGVESDG